LSNQYTFKNKTRRVKQVLFWHRYQWKREGKQTGQRRANMVHVLCMYEDRTMEPIEILLRREGDEGE
jgi:hypothetical protein